MTEINRRDTPRTLSTDLSIARVPCRDTVCQYTLFCASVEWGEDVRGE